jgi:hypothetical protein
MKIQLFGLATDPCEILSARPTYIIARSRPLGAAASASFKSKRENGEDKDSPENLSLEYDGKITWGKGEVKGDFVFVVKRLDGGYDCEVRYDAGPKDLAYFEAKDRNYLTRILNEGKLRELEPDVWCLREVEGVQNINIGEWWSQKLKLPNIGTFLENAEKLHAIATSWQAAPIEICELIANEFPFDLSPT